jgi:hypothetical protein
LLGDIDDELLEGDDEAVGVLQLPQAVVHAHLVVQRPVDDRRLAAQAALQGRRRDLADDVALGGPRWQLDADGELAELLRPTVARADAPVLHHLLALGLLIHLRAKLLPQLHHLMLRRNDVVCLRVIANLDDLWLDRRENIVLVAPQCLAQLVPLRQP